MALRSLDNALSITPERPKKVAKVAVIPIRKPSSDLDVNDENQAPHPPSAEPVIDYISSADLKPITDPESSIQILMEGLESKDWTKVCESLNNARRFALYHSPLLLPILDKVMLVMVKAMKNPRSALCKTSIMAASDIFNTFGHNLLESSTSDAFDQLLLQLLLKASQDKKFVCEEAEKSLQAMVGSIPPVQLLNKLRVYVSHSNPRVRAKSAVSISHSVSKMGLEGMKEFGLVSLIQMVADLLSDRLPEAREAARNTVTSIYDAFVGHEEFKNSELSPKESWENLCCSNLSPIQAQSLIKIILS
ncbi:CLASP N-terminal domain [Macleaya cordata]|uniref:CLASP N-terminal domain n=1 Tax=Macleaya cordata TaxID=56857 RepID=A0A200QWR8_MACCD|nr:CLASP N-terminal domain [Macleaya cordata]